ncbi:glycosyltransferase family 39 protein [Mucilaginibacter sp. JRF]|uniref:ArnT family glycosyltransferase n=1 Tax=Mucilaginibacter sp. JRF TaxID=2780088 RepID=UPI001880E05F|nr:glycosyltransferase family 39 protein [Mucilaginibacter sp. JRF]MBE9586550.1 glycosyltransferase family 39 protein [Mucilaginibacter sp. JRF]
MLYTQQTHNNKNDAKYIGWFLAVWTLFNIIQACTLELHSDEAYYWLYSRFLDWGYFDHPPMVALFIRAGDVFLHNEFGLRLVNILSSTASLYLLWKTAEQLGASAKWFILVASGMFTLHIYGFITTPDGPLLFFTALFFYVYQRYLLKDSWLQALLLGIILAGLLYSKYHGILLVGFTILADVKILKRGTFWLIAAVALALYVPHIVWQVNHNYPSVAYHLADRSEKSYRFDYTFFYILSQMLMAGVLTGWLLFYKGFALSATNSFIRVLKVNFIGIILFFLFTSLRGEVQPQWTIIAFAVLLIWLSAQLSHAAPPAWLQKLAVANIVIIAIIRLLVVAQPAPVQQVQAIKKFFGYKDWAHTIKQKAGDSWVVMNDGFQLPAKYCYYNNTLKCFSYDSRYYRLTQFEIWPLEDSVQNKRVFYVARDPDEATTDTLTTPTGKWYTGWIDSLRTYQRVSITTDEKKLTLAPGQSHTFNLIITNPYQYPINFSNTGVKHKVDLQACFFDGKQEVEVQGADSTFNQLQIEPGRNAQYSFTVKAPSKKGRYDMLFSLHTAPFNGNRNSGFITFTVE